MTARVVRVSRGKGFDGHVLSRPPLDIGYLFCLRREKTIGVREDLYRKRIEFDDQSVLAADVGFVGAGQSAAGDHDETVPVFADGPSFFHDKAGSGACHVNRRGACSIEAAQQFTGGQIPLDNVYLASAGETGEKSAVDIPRGDGNGRERVKSDTAAAGPRESQIDTRRRRISDFAQEING